MDVTVVWAAIIALGLFMYVVLDGFDLGIGIVFPFFPDEKERDLMMNTVAPVWDGNETGSCSAAPACSRCFRWFTRPCCPRSICR